MHYLIFNNMEIFLSSNCKSFTGSLGRSFGYYIRSTKKGRFFGQRSKHSVPPDGHWRFILACAQLAQNGLHIADIRVSREELASALREAHHFVAADHLMLVVYHACDIINLKTTFSL